MSGYCTTYEQEHTNHSDKCSDTWRKAKGKANTFLSQHFCHSSRSLSLNVWGRALTLVNDALSQRLCSSKSIYECKLIAFRINFNKQGIFTMFPSWTHLNATESNQLIPRTASVLCLTYTQAKSVELWVNKMKGIRKYKMLLVKPQSYMLFRKVHGDKKLCVSSTLLLPPLKILLA